MCTTQPVPTLFPGLRFIPAGVAPKRLFDGMRSIRDALVRAFPKCNPIFSATGSGNNWTVNVTAAKLPGGTGFPALALIESKTGLKRLSEVRANFASLALTEGPDGCFLMRIALKK